MRRVLRTLTALTVFAAALLAASACSAGEEPTGQPAQKTVEIIVRGSGATTPATITANPTSVDITGDAAPVEFFAWQEGYPLLPFTLEITLLDAAGQPTSTRYRLHSDLATDANREEIRLTFNLHTGIYMAGGATRDGTSTAVRLYQPIQLTIK